MISKLKYIFKVFIKELSNSPDYWHPNLISRNSDNSIYLKKYYLDFSPKGIYKFKTKEGIPELIMNKKKVYFSITIFNYGLGLIDNLENDIDGIKKIKNILKWTLANQELDGSWRNKYEVKVHNMTSGWTSAMGQGLGISFLCRCYNLNLIPHDVVSKHIELARKFMFSNELKYYYKDEFILQEFSGTSESVLNGYVFAIYGLHDYFLFTGNRSYFNESINTLANFIHEYQFFNWSYYSLTKTHSSSFYHKLHIEMMDSLFHLTGEPVFNKQKRIWKRGLKFRIIYILNKSVQKLFKFNTIGELPE